MTALLAMSAAQGSAGRGMTSAALDKLLSHKYDANDGVILAEDANCCICLMDYEQDQDIRTLPCKHHYHKECIDKWLTSRCLCPLCKNDLGPGGDDNV
jgi:hypothetical protein